MVRIARKTRDIRLDLMRFSGVIVIMIAHSHPPEWLFQLRNFGSPLLVFGSALTYAYIYGEREIDESRFFKKRLKRLTIPAWIFITFLLGSVFVASAVLGFEYPFSREMVLESYVFYEGIGFVWIFKVYIILALITPMGLRWSKSDISNSAYFAAIAAVYAVYELGVYLFIDYVPVDWRDFASKVILIVIPYSALYLYGLRAHLLSSRHLAYVILGSAAIFGGMAFAKAADAGTFVPTQEFKYPPTLYYLSYAFFCINLFYLLVTRFLSVTSEWVKFVIVKLSTYSLWIYLWHIMAHYIWIYAGRYVFSGEGDIPGEFIAEGAFLLSFGIALTYLQIAFVSRVWNHVGPRGRELLSYLK